MRRFTRISLIVAGIMAIVGLMFVGTGVAMAGGVAAMVESARNGEWDFGNWHFKDGIYYFNEEWNNVVNRVEVGNLVENVADILPVGEEHITEEFPGEIHHIEVDTDLANIVIRATGVETLQVTMEEGYLNCYKTTCANGVLKVGYKKQEKNYKQGPKITIEVPDDMELADLFVENALGEVYIADFKQKVEMLEIEASLGNVTIENCEIANTCHVEAALGNIHIEDVACQTMELEANLGDIEVLADVEKKIEAQADMGTVDVEIDGSEEDYNIEVSTSMGDVFYNGVQHKGEMSCSHQIYHEYANKDITLHSNMGDVHLKIR